MDIHPRTYEAYRLLHDGILALSRAEQQGIRVDMEYIESKKILLTRRIERLESRFKQTNFYRHWEHSSKGKVNINSNTQLAHFLYDVKKLIPQKETYSGQGATDEEALQQLNLPELNDLLEMRKLRKVRDTYLDAFAREQVGGYIHPFFNLHLVRTYRSSSDSPNFQNIPKRDEEAMQIVRQAVYPRPGHQLMEIDYSGLEVRIATCYHKDTTMLKYLREGYDMHADMAVQIFKLDKYNKKSHYILRQAAKNGFVFPEFYGDYYRNCAVNMACGWGKLPQGNWKDTDGISLPDPMLEDVAQRLGNHMISKRIDSLNKFEHHVQKIEADFWGKRFAEYAEWKKRWYNTYLKYGYIDMLTGFRCYGVMGRNDCINYPVQGAAFHCTLKSFILLDEVMRKEKWSTRLIGQIHDSIIMDVAPSELDHVIGTARRITCQELPKLWNWIIVPLDIDVEITPVDGSWADKKKLN